MIDFKVDTKYEPKQALFLDPDGKNLKVTVGEPKHLNVDIFWLKGLKIDEKGGMMFFWSQETTCFNKLDTGDCIGKYHSLTSKEDFITDLIISEEFKYFITSTVFGQIYVWKLNVKSTFSTTDPPNTVKQEKNMKTKRKLIHSFTGHTKKVTSLANHPNNTMFISASLDSTVRIWCLDKFIELYCFNLTSGITHITLLSDKLFA